MTEERLWPPLFHLLIVGLLSGSCILITVFGMRIARGLSWPLEMLVLAVSIGGGLLAHGFVVHNVGGRLDGSGRT